jgi:formate hydrogenlyase subunit 6/NADH:ubiquinone oxidoreductase subunit I
MAYFQDIKKGIQTSLKGLSLTLRHLRNATQRRTAVGIASDNYFDLQTGLVTLEYPHEQLPIPDNGRYRLHNEIDDCIVCDKCAKVCPVDCITIDAIKATEEVGRASDGSPIRLYAATFDIDMAKCCYCGLCTVVCPTECLTMDKKFDYSEFELGELTYHYAELTPAEADEKRALYEQFVQEKEAQKAVAAAAKKAASPAEAAAIPPKRPAFRPTAKPAAPVSTDENSANSSIEHPLTDATPTEMEQIAQGGLETAKRPTFQPTRKPTVPPAPIEPGAVIGDVPTNNPATDKPAPKPAFRPSMKPASDIPSTDKAESDEQSVSKPGGFRPTMKPPVAALPVDSSLPIDDASVVPAELAKPKPAFRPTMKPPTPSPSASEQAGVSTMDDASAAPTPNPAFRPTMKPTADANEPGEKKPAFRPSMKPKPSVTESADGPVAEREMPLSDETRLDTSTATKSAGFRPTMKPTIPPTDKSDTETETEKSVTSKPAGFRPSMKPAAPSVPTSASNDEPVNKEPTEELAKPKPAFRPTMKPKPKTDEGESA